MILWIKNRYFLISDNSKKQKISDYFHGIFMEFIKIPWNIAKKNFCRLRGKIIFKLSIIKNKLHNINKQNF